METKFISEISDAKYHYSFGYYAQNKWPDENRMVLIRGNTPEICTDPHTRAKAELVIYDLKTGSLNPTSKGIRAFTDFAVFGSIVYYVKNSALLAFDTATCQEKTLFSAENIESPHITADGRYISLFSCSREICRFYRVDTQTCRGELIFEKSFPEPNPFANHGMICPTDKNVIFFAHEGDTKKVSDRLWIYDACCGEFRNIAPQNTDSDGLPTDCFGHEAWAPDGRGLYFVKYRESRTASGICYADIDGSAPRLFYTGYDYWHVGASASGKYLTADTRNLGGDRSGVVLIDIKTGEETLVDTPAVTFRHPCHPHPQLSPCDTRLAYHFKNEHGNTAVKILSII